MKTAQSQKYRLVRRGAKFYAFDRETCQRISLNSSDKSEARRLLAAKNEAAALPFGHTKIAMVYLTAADPALVSRTWQDVFDSILATKKGSNLERWQTALKDKAFKPLLKLTLLQTRPENFLGSLKSGKVSSNIFLRRLHNYALDMGWIGNPVLLKKHWPPINFQVKRAITLQEHTRILEAERNSERKNFYQLCWFLGGSQGDIANLRAENINWSEKTISFVRAKLRHRANLNPPVIHFGKAVLEILKTLPSRGPLFPYLCKVRSSDRATEFGQRCRQLGINGVTLHSYRYAWAQRAKSAGYPERYAMEALGHSSKAVHRAYSQAGSVNLPSLEDWEQRREDASKIVPFSNSSLFVQPEALIVPPSDNGQRTA